MKADSRVCIRRASGRPRPMPRLRRADLNGPGISRRGRGFVLRDHDGRRSATWRRSSGSVRWRSRPRGRTSGSARTRRPHPGGRAPTRADGGSTATTTSGASGATGRSSTGCSSSRAPCRAARAWRPRDLRRARPAASACWRARSGCSTSASSGSAARRTRRRTTPTGWRRCGKTHVRLEPATGSCSTTAPRAASGACSRSSTRRSTGSSAR